MMKIMRLTRHEATTEQVEALQAAYGNIEVVSVNESLPMSPKDAVLRFDALAQSVQASVVETVLPVNLLEAVLKFSAFAKRGGQVIRSVMDRQVDGEGNAVFTFSHYEKVKEVNIVTERL